jgi:hypothetical protein
MKLISRRIRNGIINIIWLWNLSEDFNSFLRAMSHSIVFEFVGSLVFIVVLFSNVDN